MKSEICISNFHEIPVQEQQALNGGILPFIAALVVVAAAEVFADWENFKNGLMGRPEEEP